jgi:succinate-semialdehyde dehydrogenase / glutarate-semialdehyde dehydrogenase
MPHIISTNPSTWEIIWSLEITSKEQLSEIVQKSHEAQKAWGKLSVSERKNILQKVYELFVTKKEELAQSISAEMGMPILQSREEVEYGYIYFWGYLEMCEVALKPEITKETESELHTVFYEPKGVIAAIAPWNYPFSMCIWTSIQALLAGNTVIFKTSKEVILTGKCIADIFSESPLPKWVFQEIYGSGELWDVLLEQDINMVTFTGSTEVGRHIYTKAAQKLIPCVMELGGSAPGIVCDDADIDKVVETIYFLRYSNAGQMCDGLKRLIVHESRYEELISKLGKLLASKKVGNSLWKNTDIGPLVSEHQKQVANIQVQDALEKWALVLAKTSLDPSLQGSFLEPLLLWNISHDMKVWKEEVFAPILPVVTFQTLKEAIELANDTLYGLWGYVFTENRDMFRSIASELKTWEVQHNTLNYCIPENPFGGYKLSGIGREHGHWGFHEFCNIKVTSEMK